MRISKKNVSLFMREVEDMDWLTDTIRTYREYRPWVLLLVSAALIGFCIWLYTVVQVGAIELGN